MLTIPHRKELLCLAHIHALAGMAGANLGTAFVHDYGVDGQFDQIISRADRRVMTGFSLQFQAKATTTWALEGDRIVYDLESKTYNDMVMRTPEETSLLLVLLCLPKDEALWHQTDCDQTILRNCCYWELLSGSPVENEHSTKRIKIPRDQLLTPHMLGDLLEVEKQRRMRPAP